MKTKSLALSFLFLFLLLAACKNRPAWVLPENKMEDVLFDIHLADAEIEGNYQTFNDVNQKKLYDAALKKHNITAAQFDTSLVWYGANLSEYVKIYENLNNRYKTEEDTLTAQLSRENINSTSNPDNIWNGKSACVLQSGSLSKNHIVFKIDTASFEKGDTYKLHFNVLGISPNCPLTVSFSAQLTDTLLSETETVAVNGPFSASLILKSDQQARFLFGSIHAPQPLANYYITLNKLAVNQRKLPDSSLGKIQE